MGFLGSAWSRVAAVRGSFWPGYNASGHESGAISRIDNYRFSISRAHSQARIDAVLATQASEHFSHGRCQSTAIICICNDLLEILRPSALRLL